MAGDDVVLPGTGESVATDEIGGHHHQLVKIEFGEDDTATKVSASNPLPVTMASTPLPSGAATETTLASRLSESDFDTKVGALNESAPASDTASSGLNGRLQRIAQRLTSLLAVFPTTIDTNSGSKSASTLRVVLATDQPALTNKLLVTPDLPSGASTAANQSTGNTSLGNLDTNAGATSDAAAAAGSTGTISAKLRAISRDLIANIVLAAGTNTIGRVYRAFQTTKALTNASVSISSSGDNTVVSGTSSQTVRVYKLVLIAAGGVAVTIKDGASTSLTGAMPLAANGAMAIDFNEGEPAFVTSSGNGFVVNLSAAVAVTGFVQYTKS
jgi:hypothetical protein